MTTPTTDYSGSGKQTGLQVQALFSAVNNATVSAQTKLNQIKSNQSSISIGDMFEMQMLMNHLSQVSDMSTGIVSALNSAIKAVAQNVRS